MNYTWLVLYYIFIGLQNIRYFFQDKYGEYHYIKVLISGIIIFYFYKIALKTVRKKYITQNNFPQSNLKTIEL